MTLAAAIKKACKFQSVRMNKKSFLITIRDDTFEENTKATIDAFKARKVLAECETSGWADEIIREEILACCIFLCTSPKKC